MCDVVGFLLHFEARVRGGDGQTDPVHHYDVGQVIADIRHLTLFQACVRQDLFEDRYFLDMALVHVGHLALPGPLDRRRRTPAADQPGLDPFPAQPLQANAVLRVEGFGLDHVPGGVGHVNQLAVGEHAVHIHEQQLYERSHFLNVRQSILLE